MTMQLNLAVTLEDFDHSFRRNAETGDDYHGDLNYEAWLAADEVRMCVCVLPW